MNSQSTEKNTTNKKQVGALDQEAQRYGTEVGQGKKLQNPMPENQENSQGLAQDLGELKDKDYPGPDGGLTGEKPEEKQAVQSKGFVERDASGKTKDVEGNSEESAIDEDEEEDWSKTNNRSRETGQAGSNAPQQSKSSDR